jgi:hypothetical protein
LLDREQKGLMEMTMGDGSMFEKLTEHEGRIVNLEEKDEKHEERLRAIELNYTNLENTILKENRDTRQFFQDTMNKQWDLISGKNKYEDAQNNREYDLKKTRIERYSEMILKFAGAGGIVYLVVQSILKY